MKMLSNAGERAEPWGTPSGLGKNGLADSSTRTLEVQPVRYFSLYFAIFDESIHFSELNSFRQVVSAAQSTMNYSNSNTNECLGKARLDMTSDMPREKMLRQQISLSLHVPSSHFHIQYSYFIFPYISIFCVLCTIIISRFFFNIRSHWRVLVDIGFRSTKLFKIWQATFGGQTISLNGRCISSLWMFTWFERASMLVILLNCVTLGMYQPCADEQCVNTRCQILQVSLFLRTIISY